MCDKALKLFAAITILLGLATLCPCTKSVCQLIETEESQAIAEIIYHPSSEEMIVVFRDESKYSFKNVPASTFEAFKNADSKGKFFGDNIRGQFSNSPRDVH